LKLLILLFLNKNIEKTKMKLKIIDNFFTEQDFKEILSIQLKQIGNKEVKVYHNSIDKFYKTNTECMSQNFLKKLHKNYHKKAINLLNELNPDKVYLYDYSEFHIIETGANCKFPIHDDTPNKLLSGVVYVKPETNVGTIFYTSKNGKGKKTVDWKMNRAVFFSRVERETWHSYEGDGKSNRIALVYNLMTNKIKEVYKVEKKSYLIGQLRYKINPYLYKYFKFTI